MVQTEIEELSVQLEGAMELDNIEQGVKLMGEALVNHSLNKWGVRNILRNAWKEFGEIQINWVKKNTFIIIARDEDMASKILDQVPWAIMKQNFSVKRWLCDLAIEEILMHMVPFWVQMRGVHMYLSSFENAQRLVGKIGEVLEVEDLAHAREYLSVRVMVDTTNPLLHMCWLARNEDRDSWVEFRYERLQNFCYKCGRIGHDSTECSYQPNTNSAAGYGD
ncbi:hypothetical protein FF1_022884 [Malus domestica]